MTPEQLHAVLKGDNTKMWYSLKDLAQLTNEDPYYLEKTVNKSDLFVRSSSILSETGEPLYTIRSDFEKEASFGQKILGAFKNRID